MHTGWFLLFQQSVRHCVYSLPRRERRQRVPGPEAALENSFVVQDIFTDFKRHDLGQNFYERNWDGSMRTLFLTRALWGVGTTGPYGHDGRSSTLNDVILRHGGEAKAAR